MPLMSNQSHWMSNASSGQCMWCIYHPCVYKLYQEFVYFYKNFCRITYLKVFQFTFLSLHQMAPLHMAAERGRYEVVGYLVCKVATKDIQDNKGVGICDPTTDSRL